MIFGRYLCSRGDWGGATERMSVVLSVCDLPYYNRWGNSTDNGAASFCAVVLVKWSRGGALYDFGHER